MFEFFIMKQSNNKLSVRIYIQCNKNKQKKGKKPTNQNCKRLQKEHFFSNKDYFFDFISIFYWYKTHF